MQLSTQGLGQEICTPFGWVSIGYIGDLKKYGGLIYREETDDFSISSNEYIKYDDKGKKQKIYIPMAFENLKYALSLYNGNMRNALDYVQKNLIEQSGKPKYLPDWLNEQSIENEYKSYGQVFEELKTLQN